MACFGRLNGIAHTKLSQAAFARYTFSMALTFQAHSDGKVIVPDEPRDLPINVRLLVTVESIPDSAKVAPAPRRFQPLNIKIDPELSHAIALDPEFDIAES